MNITNILNKDMIVQALARIPAASRNIYPQHLFEPIRTQIACELMTKEYYKLFPFMSTQQLHDLPQTLVNWLAGEGYTLDPLTDFWNYVDSTMSGLKLKVLIVPYLTSAHVSWRLEQIDPRTLTLYAPLGTLGSLGKPPFHYADIKRGILDNPEQMRINKKDSDYHSTDTKLSRDHFPILVLRRKNGALQLLDGNRRCMRAYIYDTPTIPAWVGTVTANPPMFDHWVNTGVLCRLLADYQQHPTAAAAAALTMQLRELFAASRIARIHYEDRCVKHFACAADLLQKIDLQEANIGQKSARRQ
jgi:hypothetical protein